MSRPQLRVVDAAETRRAANRARVRRHRARTREGQARYTITADDVGLAEALVAAGPLERRDVDDKAAVERALQRVVALWIAEVTRAIRE